MVDSHRGDRCVCRSRVKRIASCRRRLRTDETFTTSKSLMRDDDDSRRLLVLYHIGHVDLDTPSPPSSLAFTRALTLSYFSLQSRVSLSLFFYDTLTYLVVPEVVVLLVHSPGEGSTCARCLRCTRLRYVRPHGR